ncbi:MAG TPA: hypothetical protein VLZ75_09065 [Chitinophagales bacterium]|nr:hypothetical protein [Chitinophagales bacterium]
MKNNRDPEAISIHLAIDGDGYDGLAISPFFPFINKYVATVALKRPGYTKGIYDKYNSNTLAHEIGHTLGLLHTHHPGRSWIGSLAGLTNAMVDKCYQESADKTRTNEWWCFVHFKGVGKKKCEINGDLLCDTDADPGQDILGNNPIECEYNYSGSNPFYITDSYGKTWLAPGRENATRNIMSYNPKFSTCPTEITPLQKADMYLYTLKHGPKALISNNSNFYTNDNIDIYENDNYWKPDNYTGDNLYFDEINNEIDVNSTQYHTFHHIFDRVGTAPLTPFAKDIDWVYFYNTSLNPLTPFVIQTMEVSGKPKPDTKITLYPVNSSGVLGAALETKDDISSSNLFSKITRSLNNGYYAVKIENKVTSTSDTRSKGHYYISVDECYDKSSIQLVASGFVCSNPKTASLLNVPTGSQYNVQWTTQNLTIIGSSTSNSVNYTRSTPGTGKLTATITSTTGCIPYVLEKVIITKYPTRILTSPFGIKSTCDDLALEELVFPIRLDPGTQATFTLTYLNGSDLDIVDVEWAYDCGSIVSQDVFTTFLGLRSDIKVNVGYGFCGELKARPVNSCGEKGPWKVKDLVHTTTPCSNGGGWSLKIAPNPSQNQIRFELDEEKLSLYESKYLEETIQIIITDSKGNISYSDKRPFGDNTIDIGKLKAGLYHLTLLIGEQVMNGKFTKVE